MDGDSLLESVISNEEYTPFMCHKSVEQCRERERSMYTSERGVVQKRLFNLSKSNFFDSLGVFEIYLKEIFLRKLQINKFSN